MKIKFRVWILDAPTKSPLDLYSHFPIDMLRYDCCFVHKSQWKRMQDDTGKRKDQSFALVYVQFPGYRTSVMTPNFERYASFGNWTNFKRLNRKDEANYFGPDTAPLSEWITIVKFAGADSIPLTMTLQDFVDAKNSYAWSDAVHKKDRIDKHRDNRVGYFS